MSEVAVRLLIVDDHAVVRRGLESVLSQSKGMEVVGSVGSGEEALQLIPTVRPDIVLLDLEMEGLSGLDVLKALRRREDSPRVIVLTVHSDDDIVLSAVRGGADGYALKNASLDDLLGAIRRVSEGATAFDGVVVKALLREQDRQTEQAILTPREKTALRLIAEGHGNRDVARIMSVSVGTVKAHLDDVYRKLEVSDRAHAVAVALRRGLLDDE